MIYDLKLDRSSRTPLAEQIRSGIEAAIATGVLAAGARLPSWRDLAAQLGVARGTVRAAYERLLDAQLIVSSRASGTRVVDHPARGGAAADRESVLPEVYRDLAAGVGTFQMGVPAMDVFPDKLFARVRAHAARAEVKTAGMYPDPRGALELRRQIAAHLAVSRGLVCLPSQIVVTAGFAGALGLILHALQLAGRAAWVEEPGFPLTRRALQLAQLTTESVPVDGDGVVVERGVERAPDARLAVVTAGQQAPLGPALSSARRRRLLAWAEASGAWIVEDDYLGELQLSGRAAPALASLDRGGRVLHVGSFSKTVCPSLRLGFVVAPPALAPQIAETASCLAPAPGPAVQLAMAELMRDGHYMRHLRRMKRVYAARRDALQACLAPLGLPVHRAGLALLLELPDGAHDQRVAHEARAHGLAPSPLSLWYANAAPRRVGLLLSVATAPPDRVAASCERLRSLIDRFA